jgi:tetratricopeptide (TPR) repeat protein
MVLRGWDEERRPVRKSVRCVVCGLIAVVIGVVVTALHFLPPRGVSAEEVLADFGGAQQYGGLTIEYPVDETLFPADMCAPTFVWRDENGGSSAWVVSVGFAGGAKGINRLVRQQEWTPIAAEWEAIRRESTGRQASITVLGVGEGTAGSILSSGGIRIETSGDPVGAPIFYREVNLPFVDAVKDPSRIRWRFGTVSDPEQPPVVLEGLPVCGNCHSFSRGGDTLAMDVDYANSKGSYVMTEVAEEMTLVPEDIITWDSYRKEDGEQTFGLLSQISPDGRYVVSTVKDKSVFVPQPDIAFSQLFFPLKGILCVYDRARGTFEALPGADDPAYVQSNPTWSPDGKYIVFARAAAYDLSNTKGKGKVLLTRDECREFTEEGKEFKFDLYRIPFNDGKGGQAEPVAGASGNGKSNYFAKYSPDGKWIVFCMADNYMLLQPDSELYIVAAEGGEARRLRANTSRMNSWHSFSPNGKWLVFSSKANGPFTQLFLTHIDDDGNSTPAVLLSNFTSADRAANIPEFVNAGGIAIKSIRGEFLDDYSFVRAGDEFFKAGDADNAIEEYRNALQLNPKNATAHRQLGFLLYNVKRMYEQGITHYRAALEYGPEDPRIHHDIGMAFLHAGKFDEAAVHLSTALSRMPDGLDKQYNAVDMRRNLAMAMIGKGDLTQAEVHLLKIAEIEPKNAANHYLLASILAGQWKLDEAVSHCREAVSLEPRIDTSPYLHELLAMNYAKAGRFAEAVSSAQKAVNLAAAAGDEVLAEKIRAKLDIYRRQGGGTSK